MGGACLMGCFNWATKSTFMDRGDFATQVEENFLVRVLDTGDS